LFHEEWQTNSKINRHYDANSRFRNYMNAPNNKPFNIVNTRKFSNYNSQFF